MTFDDIARDLGVSKSTVSRALSGKGRIGEETRNRIIAYANHQKLEEEKEQKGELTHNLGVVFPEDVYVNGNPYFHDCLLGICETAAILDYNVLLATGTAMDISKIRKLVEHKKVDGIILTRSLENDKAIEYLLKQNFPVGLTGLYGDERVIQVDTDNESAAENMTSLLISKGFRRFALLVEDLQTLRVSCRHDETHGYVFFNNYQRRRTMAEHKHVILKGSCGEETVTFPAFDLQDKEYGFFPYRMKLGEAVLKSALATPLCRLAAGEQETYVFYGDRNPFYEWETKEHADILHLTRKEALNAWRVTTDQDYLILSDNYVWEQEGEIYFTVTPGQRILSYPALKTLPQGMKEEGTEGRFHVYLMEEKKAPAQIHMEECCDEQAAGAVRENGSHSDGKESHDYPIGEADLEWILHRNCEGTEQLQTVIIRWHSGKNRPYILERVCGRFWTKTAARQPAFYSCATHDALKCFPQHPDLRAFHGNRK